MTNLGGHCIETLTQAFDSAQDEKPTLFIAYTVKGYGLPLAGHKDNHSGMMNPPQIAQLRSDLGIKEGEEWEPWGGLGDNVATQLQAFVEQSPISPSRAMNWPTASSPPRRT
jgi:pyruvate dehydrogenase E1 component